MLKLYDYTIVHFDPGPYPAIAQLCLRALRKQIITLLRLAPGSQPVVNCLQHLLRLVRGLLAGCITNPGEHLDYAHLCCVCMQELGLVQSMRGGSAALKDLCTSAGAELRTLHH